MVWNHAHKSIATILVNLQLNIMIQQAENRHLSYRHIGLRLFALSMYHYCHMFPNVVINSVKLYALECRCLVAFKDHLLNGCPPPVNAMMLCYIV